MWVIAGVLLGLVVLASLVGFHAGPHVHGAAGVLGLVAAAWLIVMAVDGKSLPILLGLLTADLVVSAGVGVLAWKALTTPAPTGSNRVGGIPQGAEGVALGDLSPGGVVRVNGEEWSATSMNGFVRAGARVQVIGGRGVRLEVWGEEALPGGGPPGLAGPAPHLDSERRGS
ncbi:MAG: NfeD family protein [Acidimicrobiales bacterium]|jgi:membrane-bound ClpP family serine protease